MWLFHETGGGGSITSRSYAAVAPGGDMPTVCRGDAPTVCRGDARTVCRGDAPTVLLKAALPHDRRSER
jgi:hypothetical protein